MTSKYIVGVNCCKYGIYGQISLRSKTFRRDNSSGFFYSSLMNGAANFSSSNVVRVALSSGRSAGRTGARNNVNSVQQTTAGMRRADKCTRAIGPDEI